MWAWLRALFAPGRVRALRSGPPRPPALPLAELPADLRDRVAQLGTDSRAVTDAVHAAIADYLHLREVLLGPGAGDSAIDDAMVLAEAELTLRSLIDRAQNVSALVGISARRPGDRAGREATGDAMLHLRDQARALHDTASAAIRWAASRDRDHARLLSACAERMRAVTAAAEREHGED